jgi:hypothetical protein
MKTLTNYIKASQTVNEGLISEIILKLLDASLSWLGAASKFVADNVANAAGELWKSGKGMTKEFWDDFRERSHYRGNGMPRNEKELSKYMAEMYKYNDLGEIKDFLEKYKDTLPSDVTVNFYIGKAKETLLNDKSSKEEKDEALKILKEAKAKYPKLKEDIDKILKEYNKKNKPVK